MRFGGETARPGPVSATIRLIQHPRRHALPWRFSHQTIQTLAAIFSTPCCRAKNLTKHAGAPSSASQRVPGRAGGGDGHRHGALRHYGWLRGALDQTAEPTADGNHIDRLLIVALSAGAHPGRALRHCGSRRCKIAPTKGGRLKGLTNTVLRNFQRRHDELACRVAPRATAFWNHPDSCRWARCGRQKTESHSHCKQSAPADDRTRQSPLPSVADWLSRLQEAGLEGRGAGGRCRASGQAGAGG